MPTLNWKLLTKKRASSTQGLPPGKETLAWVTNTVTLIYGERDAVLVGEGSETFVGLIGVRGRSALPSFADVRTALS
jgi:hypothetical protein